MALEPPSHPGCVLSTSGRHELRFRPDGPPFAYLGGGVASVDFGADGASRGAFVRASHGGFTLRGVIAPADLSISLAHPLALGGFVSPSPARQLTWKHGTSSGLEVAYPRMEDIELLPGAELAAIPVPCGALTLDRASFEPRSAAPEAPGEQTRYLRAGAVVPLSRDERGPPVARIHVPKAGDEPVTLVDTRGPTALIRWERPWEVVFGWVPTARLATTRALISDSFSNGDIGLIASQEAKPLAVKRCPHDLPIIAEIQGQRRTIGNIASGTHVPLLTQRPPLLSVALPSELAAPLSDAKVGVLATHLKGCEDILPSGAPAAR